jgi:hypothetical protein
MKLDEAQGWASLLGGKVLLAGSHQMDDVNSPLLPFDDETMLPTRAPP